jgi:hypothetical protein
MDRALTTVRASVWELPCNDVIESVCPELRRRVRVQRPVSLLVRSGAVPPALLSRPLPRWFGSAKSCCNKIDCYLTEIKMVRTSVFAKRREEGQYILASSRKIEQHRDNPDGRNRVCMPPPNHSQTGSVFCFSLGVGYEEAVRFVRRTLRPDAAQVVRLPVLPGSVQKGLPCEARLAA